MKLKHQKKKRKKRNWNEKKKKRRRKPKKRIIYLIVLLIFLRFNAYYTIELLINNLYSVLTRCFLFYQLPFCSFLLLVIFWLFHLGFLNLSYYFHFGFVE